MNRPYFLFRFVVHLSFVSIRRTHPSVARSDDRASPTDRRVSPPAFATDRARPRPPTNHPTNECIESNRIRIETRAIRPDASRRITHCPTAESRTWRPCRINHRSCTVSPPSTPGSDRSSRRRVVVESSSCAVGSSRSIAPPGDSVDGRGYVYFFTWCLFGRLEHSTALG